MDASAVTTQTKELHADVVAYLKLHHVITLSTSSFTGMPHADTVVYTNDNQALYFFCVDGSQILRNIQDSRHVSFTIDDYTTDWRKVRELQGVGRCLPATPEQEIWAAALAAEKFGAAFTRPVGILHRIVPSEMHFVDYDYATVANQTTPDVHTRIFRAQDEPQAPAHGAVSTSLDRLTFEAGQVIFRPGDDTGQYYVVVSGEVEVRAEGFGADQTVTRVGSGQFFGDQASLRGQRGAFTAHAVAPTVLLAVQREAIRDLLLPEAHEPT